MSGPDPASLERLHDVVAPPPIAWWPLAPGWYGVAICGIGIAIWLVWRTMRRRRRDRYRVEALAELSRLRTESLSAAAAAAQLMILLKRTALTAYPRAEIASLHGDAWWRDLDDRDAQSRFANGVGATLERLAYRLPTAPADASEELASAFAAVEGWIRGHRPIEARPATHAADGS